MSDSDSWSIVSGGSSNDERNISNDEDFTKIGRDEKQSQDSTAPRRAAKESAAQFQYTTGSSSSRQPTAVQPDPYQVHKHFGVPTMSNGKNASGTVPQLASVATLPHMPSNSLITIGRNLADQVVGSLGGLGSRVESRQNSPISGVDHSDNESLKDDQERLQKHKEKAEHRRSRAARTSIRTSMQVGESEQLIPSSSTNKRKVPSSPSDFTSSILNWKHSPPLAPNDGSKLQREFVQNYRGRSYREPRTGFEMSRGIENEMRRSLIDGNLPIRSKVTSPSDVWSNFSRGSTPDNSTLRPEGSEAAMRAQRRMIGRANHMEHRNMKNPAAFETSMDIDSATQVHSRSRRPSINFDPSRTPPSPPLNMQTSMHNPPTHITAGSRQTFGFGPVPPTQPRNSSLFNEREPSTSDAATGQIFSFSPVSSQPTQPIEYWSLVNGVCTPNRGPVSGMLESNSGARTGSPDSLESLPAGNFEPQIAGITHHLGKSSKNIGQASLNLIVENDPDAYDERPASQQVERDERRRAVKPERHSSQSHPLGRAIARETSDRFR